jgi:hypothetical protein
VVGLSIRVVHAFIRLPTLQSTDRATSQAVAGGCGPEIDPCSQSPGETMTDDRIIPLPNQAALPFMAPELPDTKSRYNLAAWRAGRQAALDGLTLQDCPIPAPRGYGDSIAARKAHTHYIRVYQRYWREGFRSERLFPKGVGDG